MYSCPILLYDDSHIEAAAVGWLGYATLLPEGN